MGDRKYRQHGYQDSNRGEKRPGQAPAARPDIFGPRTPNMPGSHSVVRCAGCGVILPAESDYSKQCPNCGFELHSCKQCNSFEPSAVFECSRPIEERIAKKDARNECALYMPRVTVERETSLASSKADDPRKAFDNLFKK
jgi:predicted RNA-binding Zn-ribbon protein involved in translation (DUF1610 family)